MEENAITKDKSDLEEKEEIKKIVRQAEFETNLNAEDDFLIRQERMAKAAQQRYAQEQNVIKETQTTETQSANNNLLKQIANDIRAIHNWITFWGIISILSVTIAVITLIRSIY